MKIKYHLALLSSLVTFGMANAKVDDTQRAHPEKEDETAEWQIEGIERLNKPKSNATSAASDYSKMLVGNWGGGEVVMKFGGEFSYSFEAEGSVFERGKWKFSGDKLMLTTAEGKQDTASVKFISQNALTWKNRQGNVTRMVRL